MTRRPTDLERAAITRIRTTMIGAIQAVEDIMGELWGQGKMTLTPHEIRMDRMREAVRNRILNLGNDQIRALERQFPNVRNEA